MLFSEVLGLPHIKNHLITTANRGRVPHAQLFAGNHGSGLLPMAIAYARYILCNNSGEENEGGILSCNAKFKNLSHPDLHFAFPVATTDKIKSHPVSSNFLDSWRLFIKEEAYGSLFDWYQRLGIENKQGQMGVDEATREQGHPPGLTVFGWLRARALPWAVTFCPFGASNP